MKYLWNDLNKISTLLKSSSTKLLLLDFDGTLTPIVKFPKEANLSEKTRNLLQTLSRKQGFYLAILSGRSLKDLKEKVGLSNLIYGGNHGLEGEIYGTKYSFPLTKKHLKTIKDIHKKLGRIVDKFAGALIENKKTALGFHYRAVEKYQIARLKRSFNKILKEYRAKRLVCVISSKKAYDIYPFVNWNKGYFANSLVDTISQLTGKTPVTFFIGDDKTDKAVFQLLKNGITIRVGRSQRSLAQYNLNDTKDVYKFLEWLSLSKAT